MKAFVLGLLLACSIPESSKLFSAFAFIPKDVQELESAGYVTYDGGISYKRHIQDTIEYLRVIDLKKSLYAKDIYITKQADSTFNYSSHISRYVDSVVFELPSSLLVYLNSKKYLIIQGYSSKKNYYLVRYYNLHSHDDKKFSIEFLISQLESYPEKDYLIVKALEYIDKDWKTVLSKDENKVPSVDQ